MYRLLTVIAPSSNLITISIGEWPPREAGVGSRILLGSQMKMIKNITFFRILAILVWLPFCNPRVYAAEPSGSATSGSELSVSVGKQTAVFRRIDPKRYGIRYPAFYMLETEVTNAQYKEYLDANGGTKDDGEVLRIREEIESGKRSMSTGSIGYSVGDKTGLWSNNKYPEGQDDYPVALVTLSDAQNFCKWLNQKHPELGLFRLPTWNEWMIAAYGRDRSYPWGDEWAPERVHMSYGIGDEAVVKARLPVWNTELPKNKTEPVKARAKGRTPEGVYGMLGNVDEYIVDGDPTSKKYFNLGSRWMGGNYSSGWDLLPRKIETVLPPRQDYWGYSHNTVNRTAELGFRVLLDQAADEDLFRRKPLFDQNDTTWMCTPTE